MYLGSNNVSKIIRGVTLADVVGAMAPTVFVKNSVVVVADATHLCQDGLQI